MSDILDGDPSLGDNPFLVAAYDRRDSSKPNWIGVTESIIKISTYLNMTGNFMRKWIPSEKAFIERLIGRDDKVQYSFDEAIAGIESGRAYAWINKVVSPRAKEADILASIEAAPAYAVRQIADTHPKQAASVAENLEVFSSLDSKFRQHMPYAASQHSDKRYVVTVGLVMSNVELPWPDSVLSRIQSTGGVINQREGLWPSDLEILSAVRRHGDRLQQEGAV